MLLHGKTWLWLANALVLSSYATGCGGNVSADGTGGTGGSAGGGAGGKAGKAGASARDAGRSDAARDAGRDGFVDPTCPDARPPEPDLNCDPFNQPSGCGAGQGCYPFVVYQSERCEYEKYGTRCVLAGRGTQGAPCGDGEGCAVGFSCLKTGQGVQCVRLCPIDEVDSCPAGLICEPVDVGDIGGCF